MSSPPSHEHRPGDVGLAAERGPRVGVEGLGEGGGRVGDGAQHAAGLLYESSQRECARLESVVDRYDAREDGDNGDRPLSLLRVDRDRACAAFETARARRARERRLADEARRQEEDRQRAQEAEARRREEEAAREAARAKAQAEREAAERAEAARQEEERRLALAAECEGVRVAGTFEDLVAREIIRLADQGGQPSRIFVGDDVRQALAECDEGDEFERHRCAGARKAAAATLKRRSAVMELNGELGTYDFRRRAFPVVLPVAGLVIVSGSSYAYEAGRSTADLAFLPAQKKKAWARVPEVGDAETARDAGPPLLLLALRLNGVVRANQPERRLEQIVRAQYRLKPTKQWQLPARVIGVHLISRADGRVL